MACPVAVNALPRFKPSVGALPQLNLRKVDLEPKSWSRKFPKQVTFSMVETYPIEWNNRGISAKSGSATRRADPSREHGTHLDSADE